MPFTDPIETSPLLQHASRLRKNNAAAVGVTIVAVGVATAARSMILPYIADQAPFLTFYPAVTIAALVGGVWCALLAVALSAVVTLYLFIPPAFSFASAPEALAAIALFCFVCAIVVWLVVTLNHAFDRLVQRGANIRTLIENAPHGVVVLDERGRISAANPVAHSMFGYETAELIGREAEALVPGSKTIFDSAQSRPVGTGRDMSGLRKDGSRFPVEVGVSPVHQNGRPAVVATLIDISERRKAEERQQMLTRELLHRSQNLFAVIQALAIRSLAEGKNLADAKADFLGRLQALARSNALIVEEGGETAPLEKIIRRELDAFKEHLRINGCSIRLNRRSAQNFALIVHELGTNAVKYGALSQPTGLVTIEGQLDEPSGLFTFYWRETGGPVVVPPQQTGFGTTVLKEVGRQVGDHAKVQWDAKGLVFELGARVHDIGEDAALTGHER